ncbi:unnamed protein product [Ceutorhynchus assimilis]|uniref:Luciferin 4-monooxygenase n=1 Tax=Ceutorhynchus assimilis TaxID=467358 RepID=A0A9P0GN76_9CUCU|nr:unnamed protein product [Ceutorhynchus assimilis]
MSVEKMSKLVKEDDIHVIHGSKSHEPLSKEAIGKEICKTFQSMQQDAVAMIDVFTKEKLLYSELFQKSVNLAVKLRQHGYCGQNTILAICSENCLEFFTPVYASLFNGSIMAPINHLYTPHELEHALNISKPKLVFCSASVLPKLLQLKKQLNFVEKFIVLVIVNNTFANTEDVQSMDDFLQNTNISVSTFKPFEGVADNMAALILCSSGTTGLPKGVVLSHQCLNVIFNYSRDPRYKADSDTHTSLCVLPLFHAYGLMTCLTGFSMSRTIILFKNFDEDIFLKSIQDYKINWLGVAPPLVVFFAKTQKLNQYDLSSLKGFYCGAAPLSKTTEEQVKKRLNISGIRQAYGMTETTLGVTGLDSDDMRSGSCGKVLSSIAIKIRDPETGRSLQANNVGEICVKAPCVMMGYYQNEQATKDTFTPDGWLKTGDLGYYDEEGYFYIVDRLKELIKYKGYQVAPAELESILINHPKIDDTGVVGLPDELVGEKPLAFVVKKAGADITEAEIKQFVAGFVSPQKRLTGGVIFLDSIPKNPSGKILRKELRKIIKNTLASKL